MLLIFICALGEQIKQKLKIAKLFIRKSNYIFIPKISIIPRNSREYLLF